MGKLSRSLSLKLALSVLTIGLSVALAMGYTVAYLRAWGSDTAWLIGVLIVVIVGALVVLVLLRVVLFLRVAAAVSVLRQIESGDYEVRLTKGLSPDEVGDLLRGINALAAQLERLRADREGQIADLAEAKARAQEREQQIRNLFTASYLAERALHESEELRRTLVEHISIGVTLHGARGEFLICNPAATTLFGVPTGALLGKTVYDNPWSAIDESGAEIPLTDRPVERVIRTGQPVHDMVFGLLPVGRRERVWLLAHATPQRDADGRLCRVLCSFSDITERRRIDQQLRQAQKMEAVGRLAGGIAHDFNNILTVIIGVSDMILIDDSATPDLRQDIDLIRASSLRAADLTRQLLAFSRRQVLKPQTICLNTVIQSIEVMLRRLIGEHITLITRLDPDLALISADPSQIEQVIMNLSINSRDAMPHGGQLLIETANVATLTDIAEAVPGLAAGDYILLAVSDTGTGIVDEHHAHVFEPFFTTKPVGQGTGLGLSTVHGIVRQSGGAMRFASHVGAGTRFEIYLPQASDTALLLTAEETLDLDDDYLGSEVVLVVEDECPLRELTRRVLAQHGYTVLTAVSGDHAQLLLHDHGQKVDMLLTDLVMPGSLSGMRLAASVLARSPTTRVIYMSGYTDTALTMQREEAPDAPLLQKPFTPSTLVRLVRAVFDASPP